MSPRSWVIRINDIIQAIDDASRVCGHKNVSEFQSDRTAVLATLACVQIIGEAITHIPDEVKDRFNNVPWVEIRGMRNRVVHAYFQVDEVILWETVKTDFPLLRVELEKIKQA